jgi:hypothetical protein
VEAKIRHLGGKFVELSWNLEGAITGQAFLRMVQYDEVPLPVVCWTESHPPNGAMMNE